MNDLISRQTAIYAIEKRMDDITCEEFAEGMSEAITEISLLPSAQPTLYGYNIEHLEMITRVLQKENLPPERIVETLNDIGRIIAIIRDEFEETLRRVIEQ